MAKPSDRAIAQAFWEYIDLDGVTAQWANTERVFARAREIDAAAPDGAQPIAIVTTDDWGSPKHFVYTGAIFDLKAGAHKLYTAPPSQDAEDAARLDFIESQRFDVCPLEGGGFDVYRYREGSNETVLVASGATAREAIDAARAAGGGGS